MKISEMDREWAQNIANRILSESEILAFKNDYEDWISFYEDSMDQNPANYTDGN
jgi:hypothetical protein